MVSASSPYQFSYPLDAAARRRANRMNRKCPLMTQSGAPSVPISQRGASPLLVYRGQLGCELLPAAIAADPGVQRANLSVLGMTTVASFDCQSSRINRHVPVHVDVNDFLIRRVAERIKGSPTL